MNSERLLSAEDTLKPKSVKVTGCITLVGMEVLARGTYSKYLQIKRLGQPLLVGLDDEIIRSLSPQAKNELCVLLESALNKVKTKQEEE